ncbi:MAG: cupredoxin domain-containing protein [Candidatus Paceibacterota bacterium]
MKGIMISILIVVGLISVAIFMSPKNPTVDNSTPVNSVDNVSIVNGQQIIELNAKGGYQPRKSVAKAGLSTTIRFNTRGTFDCSSSVRIPSLNISKFLPQTGSTDIDIGVQSAGIFKGSCGMGMYPFEIDFQN